MSDSGKAVFLSYAREDAAAARRIAEALRAHGLEVWFDEHELRGGDVWDAKIRRQIDACALFVPIISAHTDQRSKGYFRLEWKLAVDQIHLRADGVPFLAPVVIDDTRESNAIVPAEFVRVQLTRLPEGLPTPQFVGQVKRLLDGPRIETGRDASRRRPPTAFETSNGRLGEASLPSRRGRWAAVAVVVIIMAAGITLWRSRPASGTGVSPVISDHGRDARATSTPAAQPPLDFASAAGLAKADAKSIAVLPFANLSTDKENEFFADGVHDDVITHLAKIRDLTVISRTSVLAYRDTGARNLKKIAAELNVASVLEGSVRRAGNRVQVNAQLIDARTDAHLWAESFSGETSDIFALQARLAQEIAGALKATLTTSERALIERRLTQNQEAYELYTRARLMEQTLSLGSPRRSYEPIISFYEQAVAKDPAFAHAFARLAIVHGLMYWFGSIDATPERRARAQAALESALRIAPDAPETHVARGDFAYRCNNDWRAALAEYALAEPRLPSDASLHSHIGIAHRRLGQWPEALRRIERAAALNPHNLTDITTHVETAFTMRRYSEARSLAVRYLAFFPAEPDLNAWLGQAQFALDGDRAAYARSVQTFGAFFGRIDPTGPQSAYLAAMVMGDLAAAERALADPRLPPFRGYGGIVPEPSALPRAQVAFLRGRLEAAAQFAADAIAFYRDGKWTRRQEAVALLRGAEAKAFAGQADAAIRDAREAVKQYRDFDAFVARHCEFVLGRIYATLDRRDEAFSSLRNVMNGAGNPSPNEVRIDPIWSRLKDDPRFEAILSSATSL